MADNTQPSKDNVKAGAEAALAALAGAAEALPPKGNPAVAAAFALGWQMAELYEPGAWSSKPPEAGADLPGLSDLSGGQHATMGLDQVDVALDRLKSPITENGLASPSTAAARVALSRARPTDEIFRAAVFDLHVSLLTSLTAANFKLGKAYGLGRALADTTRSPLNLTAVKRELGRHRVATLQAWLLDLTTAFPPHAARSVNDSLGAWRDWAEDEKPRTNSGEDESRLLRLLRRQGERWRGLLSAEREPTDLLELQDYVLAGSDMLLRLGSLSWRFVARFSALLAFAAALFAGGIVIILTDSNAAHIAAGVGGLVASAGLTWKGAGTSLGKAMGRIERPLWESALDNQIAVALTMLPGTKEAKSYTPPG